MYSLPRLIVAFLTAILIGAGCASGGSTRFRLSVAAGLGTGSYSAGAVVMITAGDPPDGMRFDRWVGDVEHAESSVDSATTVTMPSADVELTATFKGLPPPPEFVLTVLGGTPSGFFPEGAVVTVVADPAPPGREFAGWLGDTPFLADPSAASTSLTMSAGDVSVTASYGDAAPVVVPTWHRHVVSLPNTTFTGNPFELELDATFTHDPSGVTITLPGYYAGNDTWKVAFMPTRVGSWSYRTSSVDSDLDGRTGTLTWDEGGGRGVLGGDPDHARKWQYADGTYAVPVALRLEFFCEPGSIAEFRGVADFMKDNEILMLETRLTEEKGQFEGGRHDFIFDGDWRNHKFDLTVWDRMEERMNALAERGLGAHIMLYSDDGGAPGWGQTSNTERLMLRYFVARVASYPVVLFNTGIDIAEYRSNSGVNWIGDRIREFDPYGHPVSSRRGGGSGSIAMSDRMFESFGERSADLTEMLDQFDSASLPVSNDDAWAENALSGSHFHTAEDIRRAFWKCVVAGGQGGLVRGGGDGGPRPGGGYFYLPSVEADLESEQWLKLVNPFVRDKLGDTFGAMVPATSLVGNGFCIADPARAKILYLLIGVSDRYNPGNGGAVTVKLTDESGTYSAEWFDPRTGQETALSVLDGGADHVLTPPSTDDWILLLTKR